MAPRAPDLSRSYESFVPLPDWEEGNELADWQGYLDVLRHRIAPVLGDLRAAGLIGWYSFLVHGRGNGVPVEREDDDSLFVHLRFELGDGRDEAELLAELPDDWLWTRPMGDSSLEAMGGMDVSVLVGGNAAQAWRILGTTSEWTLDVLASHDPDEPIPVRNFSQLLHYQGNQVAKWLVDIPMP